MESSCYQLVSSTYTSLFYHLASRVRQTRLHDSNILFFPTLARPSARFAHTSLNTTRMHAMIPLQKMQSGFSKHFIRARVLHLGLLPLKSASTIRISLFVLSKSSFGNHQLQETLLALLAGNPTNTALYMHPMSNAICESLSRPSARRPSGIECHGGGALGCETSHRYRSASGPCHSVTVGL